MNGYACYDADMDVLANVMRTTQVQGVILSVSRHAAGWGFRMGKSDYVGFHYVVHGDGMLRVGSGKTLRLQQGDLVLVPGGAAHSVSHAAESRLMELDVMIADQHAKPVPPARVVTTLVCGAFKCEGGPSPLFALLPPVLHVTAAEIRRTPALDATLRLLLDETDRDHAGHEVLADRLVDALLIYVLRWWVDRRAEGSAGWLGALADPAVGRVIAALHEDPTRRWTVEDLASSVGMSRAVFAKRFSAQVGVPPLAYLTRWRIQLAGRRLRETGHSIAEIALAVGYDSEFSFSRAFKREVGVPPSAYRERHTRAA